MASLPTPGQTTPWAAQLIEWLEVEHNSDGTQKTGSSVPRHDGVEYLLDYGVVLNSTSSGVMAANKAAIVAAQVALLANGDANGHGGTLVFPPGRIYCDAGIVLEDNIHWRGVGQLVSQLFFFTDNGSPHAITQNPLSGPTYPTISNMAIWGPGYGGSALGVSPTPMSGIELMYNTSLFDVTITGFKSGVTILADHNTFERVTFDLCYDGVDYANGWVSKGDQTWLKCRWSTMKRSCMRVAPDANIDHNNFYHCHYATSPVGVLRTNESQATLPMIFNTQWLGCAWEFMGNAAFSDLSSGGGGSGVTSWTSSVIEGSFWSQNNVYKDSGVQSTYVINFPNGICHGGHIRNDGQWSSGGAEPFGTYNFGEGSTLKVVGGDFPVGVIQPGQMYQDDLATFAQDSYVAYTAGGTITAGDLLQADSRTAIRATAVVPAVGLIGVAFNSATVNQTVWVPLRPEHFTVLAETISAANVPLVQVTGAPHHVGKRSDYSSNPVIGHSWYAGGGVGGAGGTVLPQRARMQLPQ